MKPDYTNFLTVSRRKWTYLLFCSSCLYALSNSAIQPPKPRSVHAFRMFRLTAKLVRTGWKNNNVGFVNVKRQFVGIKPFLKLDHGVFRF